jgi:regulator of nucleoside diphosphate kinase
MPSPEEVPERTFTQVDYVRLTRLITRSPADTAHAMEGVLANCDLVDACEVPPTVVTMDSQVLVQEPGAQPRKLTLCDPEHAEPAAGFISVLSPAGSALLGMRVGQTAQWPTPGGARRSALILAVLFQPEAAAEGGA